MITETRDWLIDTRELVRGPSQLRTSKHSSGPVRVLIKVPGLGSWSRFLFCPPAAGPPPPPPPCTVMSLYAHAHHYILPINKSGPVYPGSFRTIPVLVGPSCGSHQTRALLSGFGFESGPGLPGAPSAPFTSFRNLHLGTGSGARRPGPENPPFMKGGQAPGLRLPPPPPSRSPQAERTGHPRQSGSWRAERKNRDWCQWTRTSCAGPGAGPAEDRTGPSRVYTDPRQQLNPGPSLNVGVVLWVLRIQSVCPHCSPSSTRVKPASPTATTNIRFTVS